MRERIDASAPPSPLLCAALVILGCALLRSMITHVATPFWDMDPLTVPSPMSGLAASELPILRVLGAPLVGLGPSGSILLDCLSLLAAALVLAYPAAPHRRSPLLLVALATIGSVGVLIHAARLDPGDMETARVGSSWLAAIWSAVALAHAGGFPTTRRLIRAVLFGLVLMLAAKAITQVAIEHRQTVASFTRDRESFLAARGWTPGSPQALAYERRLNQADATGWFGLSNVLASFAASACAFGAAALLQPRRNDTTAKFHIAAASITLLAAATLVLTRSKAGVGVALIGVGLACLPRLLAHPRLGTWQSHATPKRLAIVAMSLIAIPHAVLVARGLVGERLSEASLWFRWFYTQAAARITASSPLHGVGPAGFQDAYSLHKTPLSPEEVTSPHSIGWDYLATLGAFGAAWTGLILVLAWRICRQFGRSAAPQDAESDAPTLSRRTTAYALTATCGVPVVASLWIERGASLPGIIAHAADPSGSMLSLLLGLLLVLGLVAAWVFVAVQTSTLADSTLTFAIAIAAIVLLVHAQVEMTPVQPASAQLFMVTIGAAACGPPSRPHKPTKPTPVLPAIPVLITVGVVLWTVLPRVIRWESSLVAAAHEIEPVGRLATQLRDATRQPPLESAAALRQIADEASTLLGRAVAPRPDALEAALAESAATLSPRALADLELAADASRLRDRSTVRAVVSLCLRRARAEPTPSDREFWHTHAQSIADRAVEANPGSAWAHSLAARVLADRAQATERSDLLELAIQHWTTELETSPYGMSTVLALMQASEQLNRPTDAARWAQRALDLNHLARLDPTRQLDESTARRVRRLAQAP